MNIHKEGYPSLIGFFTGGLIVVTVSYLFTSPMVWSIVLIVLSIVFLFLLNFFRNPNRELVQVDETKIMCPADGKVVVIEKTVEDEYFKKERIQVSIFMSPLNVHVNRNPISGSISYYKYHPGAFHKAWEPKASSENERTTIVYKSEKGEILMRQIAGALARRIVCYLDKGKSIAQGDDMGFIKLGSRVDLFLPLDATINVEIGQKVMGNIDTIAQW